MITNKRGVKIITRLSPFFFFAFIAAAEAHLLLPAVNRDGKNGGLSIQSESHHRVMTLTKHCCVVLLLLFYSLSLESQISLEQHKIVYSLLSHHGVIQFKSTFKKICHINICIRKKLLSVALLNLRGSFIWCYSCVLLPQRK